jgi:NAD(P)-dependent dehydrogenase (short-subunit alcohol dehydrogenase family)
MARLLEGKTVLVTGASTESAVPPRSVPRDMAQYVTGAALPVDGGAFVNLQ